jgi:Tol biopolymer transport system component/C-terminal processing protease CtpA/Prc
MKTPTLFLLPVAALVLALAAAPAPAQLPPPEEKPIVGARMPALSPDGKRIAFVWRGDVWTAEAGGGRAYPVTSHVELDAYPLFSPDGRWIAFSSVRSGNWDVFVVPATGGEARQLTFSSNAEIATDWSPDGKYLVFSTSYDKPYSTLFSLDVNTLRFKKLTDDPLSLGSAHFAPDGGRLVFQRYGFPWTRPRYTGSAAAQLWTLDLASGERRAVTQNDRQNLWPRFLPDGKTVVAVTVGEPTPNAQWLNKPLPRLEDSAARTPNLWAFPLEEKAPRQLTRFVGGSVRCPAVARKSGDIAFEYERDLYSLHKGSKEPQKLAFYAGTDDKQNVVQRESLNTGVEEAEITRDGKTFAFLLRGDLWTIPLEKPKRRGADDAVRLTEYPGSDHDFNWSADGKTLYFVSDRDGNDRVYALDAESKKVRPIWTGTEDASAPRVSPDGNWLGFWVAGPVGESSRAGFYIKPTAADQQEVAPKRILALPTTHQGDLAWSPDMKWIAYTRRGIESGGLNLWIAPADGSSPGQNVTRLNAAHSSPAWSPDGKYLFFASDRSGGGLYVLPLKPEDASSDELEMKFEKPSGPVNIEIDFTDTPQRIRKLSGQTLDGDLHVTSQGQLYFISEGDAWTSSYDGKDARRLTTGGGVRNLRVSEDGATLYFYRNGGLFTLKPQAGNQLSQVTFNAVTERDLRAVRRAAFLEFWRNYNRRFYDNNFHGRDWVAIRARYEPLLEGVGTRDEFATLLNMMVGELEASHSEVGAAPGGSPSPNTMSLGLYFDYGYEGPGIKILEVPRRAPGSYAKTQIKPGEYLVAIDGKDVTLDENLFKVLNDKGDRDWELLVNAEPKREGARTVRYKALSGGDWNDMHYRNRVERARKLTEEKSGGKIAYVHIAGMGGENQVQFERELYEYADGKDGVIIDVRNNGGGNIADTLINWMGIRPYGTYAPRDGYPQPAPSRGWKKPIVVLMNESSYSNAEMFPYDMRAAGLAKLVGMPTPGYVIWTYGWQLVDGTRVRMPNSGVYRVDGSPLENMGEQPDVKVPLTRDDWAADRDPQLDRALELLLKKN